MQAKYGGVNVGEANGVNVSLRIDTLSNARGVPFAQLWLAAVDGYFTDSGSALSTDATNLVNVLAVPGKDFVLYDDSNNPTHIKMLNSGSTTGVIPFNVAFPTTHGAELVTFRKFSFQVRAEYPLSGTQGLLQSFQESISIIGTGGPRFVVREALVGPPQKQIVNQQTKVRATQRGRAVGYLARPFPPPPLWPAAVHEDQEEIGQESPTLKGQSFQNFGVSWGYVFESAGPLAGAPNAR